jgi:hypothetical protein
VGYSGPPAGRAAGSWDRDRSEIQQLPSHQTTDLENPEMTLKIAAAAAVAFVGWVWRRGEVSAGSHPWSLTGTCAQLAAQEAGRAVP